MTEMPPADQAWHEKLGRRPSVMADHPGWRLDDQGRLRRLLRSSDAVWLVVAAPASGGGHDLSLHQVDGDPSTEPRVDITDPATLDDDLGLREVLLAAGPVARVRTGDPWEALVGAIFRRTTPLERARTLYRDAAAGLGVGYDTSVGRERLFPAPALILELSDDVFEVYGLAPIRDRLRVAASTVRALRSGWRTLSWDGLYTSITTVPRISAPIAGPAVADLSGDFRFIVSSDFLLRHQVRALDPVTSWPENALAFSLRWQRVTGIQRADWTVLALATAARRSAALLS